MRQSLRSLKQMLLLSLAAAVSAGCVGVQGSGVKSSETRQLPAFSKVATSGAMNVDVTAGAEQSVTIEGDDNLLPIITTKVSDGRLKIGSSESYSTTLGIKVTIQVPELEAVEVSGSGNTTLKQVQGDSLRVGISGSGNVTAEGEVNSVDVRISGSGNIKLSDLKAKRGSANISGSGSIRVHTTEELNASISGSGSIRYQGNPHVTQKISGSGSIRAE